MNIRLTSRFHIQLRYCATFILVFMSACGGDLPVRPDPNPDQPFFSDRTAEFPKSSAKTKERYRNLVLRYARAQLGKPYKWGGHSPTTGFDCSGLVFFAHSQAGLRIPRMSGSQLLKAKKVVLDKLQPGDLVFFRIRSNDSHVGIFIGGREFIHAPSRGKKVRKASLDSQYWHRRFYAAGHFY